MFSFSVSIARRIDNFSVAKFEADPIEAGALINGRRIKGDMALDGILHRATENFAIGNIAIAAANDAPEFL